MVGKNRDDERKALQSLLDQLNDPAETLRKQKRVQRVFLGVGHTGLIAGFLLAWHHLLNPILASLLIAISGAFVGIGVFLGWAGKQWPHTVKYIDQGRIEARLAELEN